MPEWRVHSLAEVYDFASGLSKPRSEFGSGFPFLSFKDVFYNRFVPKTLENLVQSSDAERKKCSVKRGDVFLTRTSETMDELGMSCISLSDVPDATFNGFTKRLRPKDESYILPEYAGYYFSSPRFRQSVNAMSTMSTRASLNNDMLSRLEIVVPEPDEQLRIANVLKPLDDKIELNRRMNETLEEMARALFRDWFVDFGPTRRQMEGATDPAAIMGHAFPPEKAATLAPLFPAELGDDGLPEGWEMETLGDFVERSGGSIQTGPFGSQLHKSDYAQRGVPVLMPANLTYSQIKQEGVAYITEEKANSLAKHRCQPGDIIYGRRGDIGRKALISEAQNGWLCGTGCLKVSVHSKERSPNVLFMQLDTESAVQWIRSRAIGATMPNLNTKTLGGLPILKIGCELSAPFTEIAGPLEEKRQQNDAENQTLSALRDLLLPKLMSGNIRLKDAEAAL
nr:restriction endonuclease subunit S [Thioclava sp. JE_KL1]